MGAMNMDTRNLDYSSYGQMTWKLGSKASGPGRENPHKILYPF